VALKGAGETLVFDYVDSYLYLSSVQLRYGKLRWPCWPLRLHFQIRLIKKGSRAQYQQLWWGGTAVILR
jgi:hypothetical protein